MPAASGISSTTASIASVAVDVGFLRARRRRAAARRHRAGAAFGWRGAEVALGDLPAVRSGAEHVNLRKWAVIAVAICLRRWRERASTSGPTAPFGVATGFVAHNVCSKTFVSGLDPQAVFAEISDRAGIRRLRHVLRFQIDRTARTVDASTLGLFSSRAAFHDGLGCVELHGANEPYLLRNDVEALKAEDAAAAARDCRARRGRAIRSGVQGRARSRLRGARGAAVPAGPRRWSWCMTAR